MSLDQNLFTLNIVPSQDEPDAIDLVEPDGTLHYRKRRAAATPQDASYSWSLFEPLSNSVLSTVSAPAATSKLKTLALHNPDAVVELKYTGTLSFKWCFDWEEHTFEWRREACYMLRKPDPPVQVAVTKEPSGRIKTSVVQILDYNLHRFDINDRKGLEILMLTALLTFTDQSEEYHAKTTGATSLPNSARPSPPIAIPSQRMMMDSPMTPVAPPPPVPPKSALDRIVMAQAQQDMGPNEILISNDADVDDYARYGRDLLQDNNMLYVVLKSGGPEQVPKVLTVAEAIKRLRHKAGIEETLHLYPSYDEVPRNGPKIIRLDDPATSTATNYKPPVNLTIHLSKIPMPELQPKPKNAKQSSPPPRQRRHSNEDPWMKDPWSAPSSSKQAGYTSDTPPPKKSGKEKKGKDERRKEKHEKQPSATGKLSKASAPGPAASPRPSFGFPQAQQNFVAGGPSLNYAPGPSAYPTSPPTQAAYPPYMGRPQVQNGYLAAGGAGSSNSPNGRPLSIFDRITSSLR
ncbi:hypothetical protein EXIGLDRAFT_831994 [Exidia glandulosa HHB12029]|uniref:Uncharacterized protein n=1 Tax=Exidia glandulosa HHB12029 TaxID=1314781 RepID=A0A166B847_EXIGL|nr:hypothetical protein EXIGLDRAFT_831994 [Exidia glandulosa HHB12029]